MTIPTIIIDMNLIHVETIESVKDCNYYNVYRYETWNV